MPLLMTGVGPPPGAGPPTPPSSNMVLWLTGLLGACYEDDAGTDPCETGDAVAVEKSPNASLPSGIQTVGANRPLIQTDGLQYTGDSVEQVITPFVAVPGDFTAYFVGTVNSTLADFAPVAASPAVGVAGNAGILRVSASLYTIDDTNTFINTAAAFNGLFLLRVRREAGTVYYAFTGTPEYSVGSLADALTLNRLGQRVATGHHSDPSDAFQLRLIYTASMADGSGGDSAVQAYTRYTYGVDLTSVTPIAMRLEDGTSRMLLEDGTSFLLLEW